MGIRETLSIIETLPALRRVRGDVKAYKTEEHGGGGLYPSRLTAALLGTRSEQPSNPPSMLSNQRHKMSFENSTSKTYSQSHVPPFSLVAGHLIQSILWKVLLLKMEKEGRWSGSGRHVRTLHPKLKFHTSTFTKQVSGAKHYCTTSWRTIRCWSLTTHAYSSVHLAAMMMDDDGKSRW